MSRLVAVLLAVLLSSAVAAPPERPSPGEVIDQVAQYTGLTNDAVSLALKDNAAALGRLTDAVQALQIAQQFLDARDAEIATTVFYAAADTAAEKLLPPPLMTAIKAMRVYKSILEAVRNYIVIPRLDEELYDTYRIKRGTAPGTGNYDKIGAFDEATNAVPAYYVMQPEMVEEYIKSKGWNPDLMDERMRHKAEADITNFWRERLEATYQWDKVKPQKQEIIAAILASVKDILDQLKPNTLIDVGLFIDPTKDLPPGWWWVKEGIYLEANWGPRDLPGMNAPSMERQFVMSMATGYSYNGQFRDYCHPDGRRATCDLPALQFGTIITRYSDAKTADVQATAFIHGAHYTPIGQITAGVLNPHEKVLVLHFAYSAYEVHLTVAAVKAAQYLPLIEDFGRVIITRIAAQEPSAGAAPP